MSATPHRIPAVQALVARPASHRDAPADVAGGSIRLQLGPLLAQGVGDDGQAQVRGRGRGGADFGGDVVGAVQVAQGLVGQRGLLGQGGAVVGVDAIWMFGKS